MVEIVNCNRDEIGVYTGLIHITYVLLIIFTKLASGLPLIINFKTGWEGTEKLQFLLTSGTFYADVGWVRKSP